jgi:proteic killer suppression protein
MKIQSFLHKGVKKLYQDDDGKAVGAEVATKLRKMLTFLDAMERADELPALPQWKAHTLTGDRKGTWSLSVTANRRLTFRVDAINNEIHDMNLEDYH